MHRVLQQSAKKAVVAPVSGGRCKDARCKRSLAAAQSLRAVSKKSRHVRHVAVQGTKEVSQKRFVCSPPGLLRIGGLTKDTWKKWRPARHVDLDVSKKVCYILRHGAKEYGLHLRPDGYVKVSQLLELEFFASRGVLEEDIRHIVDSDDKKRYGLCIPEGDCELHIRAHQGHTMTDVKDDALLCTIESADELPILCHGTYSEYWPSISAEGLKAMSRNHIHCVSQDLTAEDSQGVVLSGARNDCDVIVYIDVAAAMKEGVVFHRSDNAVVLTRGHGGVLPPHLFQGVAYWDREQNA